MVDWTLLGTTLGAASITGLVGYSSAKWQGKVGLETANQETQRLRLQHREDHLRNRQATYHTFLDEASTWERTRETTEAIFGTNEPSADAEQKLNERDRHFKHLLNGVVLFGPEQVREAAKELEAVQIQITADWWERLTEVRRQGSTEAPGSVFPIHRQREWEAALNKLITAMREDVAPDVSR